jgi:ABC-type dipeptide/oligopeptide/nickel transport system permease component
VTSQRPVIDHRAERVLAYMVAGTVGASIIAFFAVMIGSFANQGTAQWADEGIWPFVLLFPLIGLPIGFILLVALLIVNGVRRSRASRRGSD